MVRDFLGDQIQLAEGTPMEIAMKVSNDIHKVLSDPAMQKRIVDAGLVVDNVSRDEWITFARKTLVVRGDVARKNKIKIQ